MCLFTVWVLSCGQDDKRKEDLDNSVLQTKTKVLEILQFIMDVRLDLRITNLLVIFKRQYIESENELGSPPCEFIGDKINSCLERERERSFWNLSVIIG